MNQLVGFIILWFNMHMMRYGKAGVILAKNESQFENEIINCIPGQDCTVICCGPKSCKQSTINCPTNFNCDIRCETSESCEEANITYPVGPNAKGTLTCTGYQSCKDMIFPEPNPNLALDILCQSKEACKAATIICPSSANCNVNCFGENACDQSTIICGKDIDCNIKCHGSDTCHHTTFNCTESSTCNIDCVGYEACERDTVVNCPIDGYCNVNCHGQQACEQDTVVNCGETGQCNVLCNGYHACHQMEANCPSGVCNVICGSPDGTSNQACQEATINCGENANCHVQCNGKEACESATFIWPTIAGSTFLCPQSSKQGGAYQTCKYVEWPIADPNVPLFVYCWDYRTCFGTSIKCPANADCTVVCGYDACSTATIECPTGTDDARCVIECLDRDACVDVDVIWGGSCNLLICKNDNNYNFCTRINKPPTAISECNEPTPNPTEFPTTTPTIFTSSPTQNPTVKTFSPTQNPTKNPAPCPQNAPRTARVRVTLRDVRRLCNRLRISDITNFICMIMMDSCSDRCIVVDNIQKTCGSITVEFTVTSSDWDLFAEAMSNINAAIYVGNTVTITIEGENESFLVESIEQILKQSSLGGSLSGSLSDSDELIF